MTYHVSHFFLDLVFLFLFIPFGLYTDLQIRWKTQCNTIGSKGIKGEMVEGKDKGERTVRRFPYDTHFLI